MSPEQRVVALAAEHHGIVTRSQALALGLSAATHAVGGSVSHRSASWLLELRSRSPPRHEVTADLRRSSRHDGVRVHRTGDLAPSDRCRIDGIPCTNATRTCIDMGARLDRDGLERLVHQALHRRLTHVDRLIARFLQLARPGRDGIATVRAVLVDLDPDLAPAESDL